LPAPKPVFIPPPQLDVSEELVNVQSVEQTEEKAEDKLTEKLSGSLSRFLGFIAALGLPPEIMRVKIIEYSQIAEETGVCDALLETIDYYFPDAQISPIMFLAIAGIAFAVAVITDRIETKKQYEKINKQNKDKNTTNKNKTEQNQ